jgi:hypothetical protein
MRRDKLKINNVIGLREIKEDLRQMLKEHRTLAIAQLEDSADQIYVEAYAKVPVSIETYASRQAGIEPGQLRDSIQVDVSRSPRYPGIIVTAEAHNPRTGYDYAFIQEVNEEYRHPNGGQAHYLEEPFEKAVAEFYRRMGWK